MTEIERQRMDERQRELEAQHRFYDPYRLKERQSKRELAAHPERWLTPGKIGLIGVATAGAYMFLRSMPDMRRYLRFKRMS